jgi:hypothetical protein
MVLRRTFAEIVAALAVLSVTAFVSLCIVVPRRIADSMSDFSAIWNTADALQRYVWKSGQWPKDWNSLKPSLAYVEPHYSDGNITQLQERVEVNFDINMESSPQNSKWYVRLKSGRMRPEQDAADERIRNVIKAKSKPSN